MDPTGRACTAVPGDLVGGLLVKHERSIRRFIARRSGPQVLRRTTVDDLYQQTVESAVASANAAGFEFRGDGPFLSWAQTVAHRVIFATLDRRRRSPPTMRIKGRESSGVGATESELGGWGRTPSSLVAGSEHKANLRAVIQELPEHYRRAITLYKLEQMPLAEVAQALGRTKGATCRIIARAMERLRSEMVEP